MKMMKCAKWWMNKNVSSLWLLEFQIVSMSKMPDSLFIEHFLFSGSNAFTTISFYGMEHKCLVKCATTLISHSMRCDAMRWVAVSILLLLHVVGSCMAMAMVFMNYWLESPYVRVCVCMWFLSYLFLSCSFLLFIHYAMPYYPDWLALFFIIFHSFSDAVDCVIWVCLLHCFVHCLKCLYFHARPVHMNCSNFSRITNTRKWSISIFFFFFFFCPSSTWSEKSLLLYQFCCSWRHFNTFSFSQFSLYLFIFRYFISTLTINS